MTESLETPSPNWAKEGTLYVTLSLLVEHDRRVEDDRENEKSLLEKIADAIKKEKGQIAETIDPMFDDIADRERHIFSSDEVLVDTGDKGNPSSWETISLTVPDRISWCTEGNTRPYNFGGKWEWEGIECRYFWYLHSNGDLSYHVSLEIPYQHKLKYYYALSLLQKSFFPSEEPEGGYHLHLTDGPELTEFLIEKFNGHFETLVGRCKLNQANRDAAESRNWWSRLIEKRVEKREDNDPTTQGSCRLTNCCSRLIKRFRGHEYDAKSSKTAKTDKTWNPQHCRAAFLLQDTFFDYVLRGREQENYLANLKKIMSKERSDNNSNNKSQPCGNWGSRDEKPVDVPEGLEQKQPELALIFLSGYLQNIIDFFQQDEAEFVDGTKPLYPKKMEEDPHFLLYATQEVLFEVVGESRSLRSGRGCIGTCPYLFLVHITLFHDEALVKRFESLIKGLDKDVKKKLSKNNEAQTPNRKVIKDLVEIFRQVRLWICGEGDKPGEYEETQMLKRKVMKELVEIFARVRLRIFRKVEKYIHLNVFRYDTEQSFYKVVTDARGIQERLDHWTMIMSKLNETVEQLHEQARQNAADLLNKLVIAISLFTILQVLFAMTVAWRSMGESEHTTTSGFWELLFARGFNSWIDSWDYGFTIFTLVLTPCLLLCLIILLLRDWRSK